MELYERINLILKEKKLTKKEFAKRLVALEPKSSRTGEVISEKIVYFYLSGKTVINPNFIPYIAEVLNITEQELFDNSIKTRQKCFKSMLKSASKDELETYYEYIKYNLKLDKNSHLPLTTKEKNIKECLDLLEYAPMNFFDKILKRLYQFKELALKDI